MPQSPLPCRPVLRDDEVDVWVPTYPGADFLALVRAVVVRVPLVRLEGVCARLDDDAGVPLLERVAVRREAEEEAPRVMRERCDGGGCVSSRPPACDAMSSHESVRGSGSATPSVSGRLRETERRKARAPQERVALIGGD